MREVRAPDARQRTSRWHPVVSGMLALLLVSMLAATAVFATKPAAVVAQSNKLDTAALAPASSAMYISVSLDQNSAQYKKATELFGRLGVSDPIQTALADVTKESGTQSAQQAQPFLGGELGFVITNFSALESVANSMGATENLVSQLSPGTTGATLSTPIASELGSVSGFAAVLKPSDPAAAWTTVQQSVKDEASKSGATVNETTYEGVTIKSVEASGDSSNNIAAAQVNDFIVVGTTAKDLEPVIDTAKGKTEPLSKSADFTKVQGALQSDFLAFGFVNGSALTKAEAAGTGTGTMSSLESMFGPSATSTFSAAGFVIWADDPGFRIDSVTLPAAGQTAPVTKNFQPQLPAKVPGDTMIFSDGFDLGKNPALLALALAAAQGITGQQTVGTPPAGMTAEQMADQVFANSAQMLGFNLKTDFLDQLQGEYGLAISVKSLDPSGINFVVVSQAADAAKLNDALSKISLLISAGAQGAVTISTKEVGGSQISVAAGEYSGMPIQVEYGVVNNQFVLGFGTSVEQFVAGGANNLAANPQYQQVMATLPSDRNSVLYIDVKGIAAVVQPFLSLMGGAAMGGGQDANAACGKFASQADAQAAYDKDPSANFDLDQNFNGKACEDYAFGGASASSSPAAMSATQALSAIQAIAAVGYEKDGLSHSSAIIYIPAK